MAARAPIRLRRGLRSAPLAHGDRVAATAETFLETQTTLGDNQSALVEFQAEELRSEPKLHHWSLRVHRVSDPGLLRISIRAGLTPRHLHV
ncbi:MAG: hypothetical protein ACREHF_01120 [Rhizomicrobium sp.]